MGASRRTSQEPTPLERDVAELIEGILIGSVVVPNPSLAVAEALANLVPSFLGPEVEADIAASVARITLTDTPVDTGVLVNMRPNYRYRALYAIAAVRRLVKAVVGPGEGNTAERLSSALQTEVSYFQAHRNAARSRTAGQIMNEAAAAKYGTLLSWHHLRLPGKQHRPAHLAAHAKNYDVTNPPASTEYMLPGMAPNCDCVPGPPIDGAPMVS